MCCHNHFSIGISGKGQGQNYFLVEWLEHRIGEFGEINNVVKYYLINFFSEIFQLLNVYKIHESNNINK